MATSNANVLMGACTVTIGGWTSSGATGVTMTDVGHTSGPVTWNAEHSNAEVMSERAMGPVKVAPIGMKIKVKVPMLETNLANLRIALRQASGTGGYTSGTNTASLFVNDPTEQYHQITLAGKGPVGGLTRVVTLWKCIVESMSEVQIAKGAASACDVTFAVMQDDTCATTQGQYMKIVDA